MLVEERDGRNNRFGCNLCKKDVPTFKFNGLSYSPYNLWFCHSCLRKLLSKKELP